MEHTKTPKKLIKELADGLEICLGGREEIIKYCEEHKINATNQEKLSCWDIVRKRIIQQLIAKAKGGKQ